MLGPHILTHTFWPASGMHTKRALIKGPMQELCDALKRDLLTQTYLRCGCCLADQALARISQVHSEREGRGGGRGRGIERERKVGRERERGRKVDKERGRWVERERGTEVERAGR